MTKRELLKRIETLEAKVAELEAWPWGTNTIIRPIPYIRPWDWDTCAWQCPGYGYRMFRWNP